MSGDLCYFTIGVPDTQRARSFYGELLGWTFSPGSVPDGFNIEGTTPPGGLHGADAASSPHVYFTVDDLDAASDRVRQLGGHVEAPQDASVGRFAACSDDQGTRFSLFQFADE